MFNVQRLPGFAMPMVSGGTGGGYLPLPSENMWRTGLVLYIYSFLKKSETTPTSPTRRVQGAERRLAFLVVVVLSTGETAEAHLLPTLRPLERFHRRNELLIASHHSLRQTMIFQTVMTEQIPRICLDGYHMRAVTTLIPREEWLLFRVLAQVNLALRCNHWYPNKKALSEGLFRQISSSLRRRYSQA
jgi:hypothetical protein